MSNAPSWDGRRPSHEGAGKIINTNIYRTELISYIIKLNEI